MQGKIFSTNNGSQSVPADVKASRGITQLAGHLSLSGERNKWELCDLS